MSVSTGMPNRVTVRTDNLSILWRRIGTGEEYLLALEEFRNRDWYELSLDYEEGRMSLPQSLALIHPDFYLEREREASVLHQIRGPRTFSNSVGQHVAKCMADCIWLTQCPLKTPEGLHSDHVFPFSLGGPTISANQLFLCPVHNHSKTNDVHLFPWERGEPLWLPDQITRIRQLLLT